MNLSDFERTEDKEVSASFRGLQDRDPNLLAIYESEDELSNDETLAEIRKLLSQSSRSYHRLREIWPSANLELYAANSNPLFVPFYADERSSSFPVSKSKSLTRQHTERTDFASDIFKTRSPSLVEGDGLSETEGSAALETDSAKISIGDLGSGVTLFALSNILLNFASGQIFIHPLVGGILLIGGLGFLGMHAMSLRGWPNGRP